jgi:hypothetical protein
LNSWSELAKAYQRLYNSLKEFIPGRKLLIFLISFKPRSCRFPLPEGGFELQGLNERGPLGLARPLALALDAISLATSFQSLKSFSFVGTRSYPTKIG